MTLRSVEVRPASQHPFAFFRWVCLEVSKILREHLQ